jgi:hypothetical protein
MKKVLLFIAVATLFSTVTPTANFATQAPPPVPPRHPWPCPQPAPGMGCGPMLTLNQ